MASAHDKVLPGRTHDMTVLGYGMQRSRGMKSGTVVDLEDQTVVPLQALWQPHTVSAVRDLILG